MTDQDFLTAKIELGFDQLDVNGNGELTEDDHVEMGRRVASSLGHADDSPEAQRIIDAYVAIWREVHLTFLPAGSRGIPKDRFVASTGSPRGGSPGAVNDPVKPRYERLAAARMVA
ncbi:hypothetical protein [Streptomyces sp. NPDC003327]